MEGNDESQTCSKTATTRQKCTGVHENQVLGDREWDKDREIGRVAVVVVVVFTYVVLSLQHLYHNNPRSDPFLLN